MTPAAGAGYLLAQFICLPRPFLYSTDINLWP
jgi:hypothetical protein